MYIVWRYKVWQGTEIGWGHISVFKRDFPSAKKLFQGTEQEALGYYNTLKKK